MKRPLCYIDHARIDVLFHCLGLSADEVARALGVNRDAVMERVNDSLGEDLLAAIERDGVALGIVSHCNPQLASV